MISRATTPPPSEWDSWWTTTKPILTRPRFSIVAMLAYLFVANILVEILDALWRWLA